MGKKKGEENPKPSELKEGHNLLGAPSFEQLDNGRFKCVETGHELPPHARDSYADSKHCRLGLIDSALAGKKPPLNMFKQDPASRSKLICRLTGVTINKTEEHIWKHINGKRFLNMLDKKEAEKEMPNGKMEKTDGEKEKTKKKKNEDGGLKKEKNKKKKIEKDEQQVDEIIEEVRDSTSKNSDSESENDDFWMPPAGERWDHDDGGDRWGSDSESGPESDDGGEEALLCDRRLKFAESRIPKLSFRMVEEETGAARACCEGDGDPSLNEAKEKAKRKDKRKKRLLKEAEKADKRGVCYLSRVPPHMDPLKLRQILSQYGEIQRVYLTPEDPAAQVRRKKSGGFRGQEFSEGWVEFTDKKVAKRVFGMLNGEQIGGRKRSSFYYDLWNFKYLSKFKWDDLTEEIAYKNATREQKLALELSAAKRERDFYLSKVDQSKALSKIEERLKKKQKVDMVPKVVRQFPQKKPVVNESGENKAQLSRDILAGVFGGSS